MATTKTTPATTTTTTVTSDVPTAAVVWTKPSGGAVLSPGNAVVSTGNDLAGHALYVVRALLDGHTVVGSVAAGSKVAHLPVRGKAVPAKGFDLLAVAVPSEWVAAERGAVPAGAVQAGFDRLGEAVYVARAAVDGSVKVPAKLLPRTGRSFAPFNGVEYVRELYEVLCVKSKHLSPSSSTSSSTPTAVTVTESKTPPMKPVLPKLATNAKPKRPKTHDVVIIPPTAPRGLAWVGKADGEYDSNVVHCAVDKKSGAALFSARAREGNEYLSGVLQKGMPHALLPYHGKAYAHSEYEVLVRVDPSVHLLWVPAALGAFPDSKFGKPVQSGANNHGDKLYVGRITVKGQRTPGKFFPKMGRTYVASNGREFVRKLYEVLVVSPHPAPAPGSSEEKALNAELKQLMTDARKAVADSNATKLKVKPAPTPLPVGPPAPEPTPTPVAPPAAQPDYVVDVRVPRGMRWMWAEDGDVPKGAVEVGRAGGREVYVVRAVEDFKLLVGGVCAESPGAVPNRERASAVERYEVLTARPGLRYVWVKLSAHMPERAVQGGYDAAGVTYVSRACVTDAGDYAAGYVNSQGTATFPWEDDEVTVKLDSVEVLVELGQQQPSIAEECVLVLTKCVAFTLFLMVCCKTTKALKKRS